MLYTCIYPHRIARFSGGRSTRDTPTSSWLLFTPTGVKEGDRGSELGREGGEVNGDISGDLLFGWGVVGT